MTIPKSIKRWITRETGYNNEDSHFRLKRDALEKAKQSLLSGKKRIVHIAYLSDEMYQVTKRPPYPSIRAAFENVETWALVNGVPKRVGG